MHEPNLLSRPFGGAAEDMEFDFAHGDRAHLVTRLLAACARPADEGHWWACTVGERTATLLGLLQVSEQREALQILLRCTNADCGERIEIELSHAALDELARRSASDAPVTIERDAAPALVLRRPIGEDLRAWQALLPTRDGDARAAMLERLCLSGQPRPDDLATVSEALSQADPLVAFSVQCSCPACGDEAAHDIDLEGLALQRLAGRQQALIQEVHVMASRYGWSEEAILAIGPARRARYLDLIEGWA